MTLTREHKLLLTCTHCGGAVLGCECYPGTQYHSALRISETQGDEFWEYDPKHEPVADEQPGAVPQGEKCAECLYWEGQGGTVVNCFVCKNGTHTAGIPATAQAILDLGKQPAPRAADERGSGVARAVARLSEREYRLGCHAWRP
jgi:hypothetical protein